MPQAKCRCGQTLNFEGTDARVVCPSCGARVGVRLRRDDPAGQAAGDGYIRFHCPCGRRLKVQAAGNVRHGRCPDCDRVVPVPEASTAAARSGPTGRPGAVDAERKTEELPAADAEALEAWIRRHQASESATPAVPVVPILRPSDSAGPSEAGLRVCPSCRRPVHLGADACRHCGTAVPRR